MSEIKHIGRIITTGKKCIVAYRTLPGDAHNCLIVPTENLPDSYHDAIINLVESTSGQDAHEFAEVMARTNFPDGSIMLAALHVQGRLIKVSTDLVEMLPQPGVTIQLSELNQLIAEQRGVAVDDLSMKSPNITDAKAEVAPAVKAEVAPASSSVTESTPIVPTGTPEEQAKQYRSQADKLAKEAASYRRLAEELVPTVKKTK